MNWALAGLMMIGGMQAISASAQEAVPPTADSSDRPLNLGEDRITIGVGAAVVPRYIGSNETIMVPSVALEGQVSGIAFQTQGTSINLDLVPDHGAQGWKVQAGPILNVRLDRTAMLGSGPIAALGKLKTAWEPGAWIGVQRTGVVTSPYDTLSLSVSWQHDIAGAYGGYIVSPSLSYDTPLSHHDYVSLSAGADYVGARMGDYYYDIDAGGSLRSGLRPYSAAGRAGWKDWNLSLLAAHTIRGDLTHGVALFATMGYSRLLGVYARSPIVADIGDASQWGGSIGVAITL